MQILELVAPETDTELPLPNVRPRLPSRTRSTCIHDPNVYVGAAVVVDLDLGLQQVAISVGQVFFDHDIL